MFKISEVPAHLKQAILVQDDRFYEHGGLITWEYYVLLFKFSAGSVRQGASTITMQSLAFSSLEKNLTRKFGEATGIQN